MTEARRATTTSSFGVSRRENHDASVFYSRFDPPQIDDSETLGDSAALQGVLDSIIVGDSRHMDEIPDATVALVVTSPPYFVGKEYEADVANGRTPATYTSYLDMLEGVFSECVRILEPGGRMAVNVANLGRKPYRSLSGDVLRILEGLGLLPRGEIIWIKARAAGGSTAWGSFQSPVNPVLRDLTERVVVVSKHRFDRTPNTAQREKTGLPHESTVTRDEFIDATTDTWEIPAESATAVGHPAPFPVELPRRLIELFTYADDVVVDPFMGSGSTAVAAKMTGRHYIGYDTDPVYVERAEARLATTGRPVTPLPADDALRHAQSRGLSVRAYARLTLEAAGYGDVKEQVRHPSGITLDLVAKPPSGTEVGFLISGSFSTTQPGTQIGTVLRQIGSAATIRATDPDLPVVILSPHLPPPTNPAYKVLESATTPDGPVAAMVGLLTEDVVDTLREIDASTAGRTPGTE